MTSTIEWLNGYAFWRAQYTSRNEQYKNKTAVLKDLSSEFLRRGLNHHPPFEIRKLGLEWSAGIGKPMPPIQEDWPFTSDMLCIVIAYRNIDHEIRSEFPYAEPFLAGVDKIIESLCDNTFPPICGYVCDPWNRIASSELLFGHCEQAASLVWHDKSELFVKIDATQEISVILDRIRLMVERAKQPPSMEAKQSFLDFVREWKGAEAAAQYEKNDYAPWMEPTIDIALLDRRKRESKGKYRPGTNSDRTRVIGLWLCDYIDENQVEPMDAVRALRGKEFFNFLGKADSENSVMLHIVDITKKCIERADVLGLK